MNTLTDKTFFKFLIIGIINTFVGTAIMFSLYNLAGCTYWVSSAANYILVSILSFFLNKNFTFRHKGDTAKSALRFAVNIAVCYLLAYGIAKPVVFCFVAGTVTFRENTAMFVGMCLFTIFNYWGQKLFAFKQ